MNTVARVGLTTVPGSLITFLLLSLMVILVFTGDPALDEETVRVFKPPYHVETRVDPQVKEAKPVKHDDVETQPKRVTDTYLPPKGSFNYEFNKHAPTVPVIGNPELVDSDFIPLYVPQPRFPPKAVRNGVSGYAVISVIVTKTGNVREPVVVEEYPQGYGFGRYALQAAEKLKYNPRVINGTPEEVPDVQYKFSFNIE